MLRLDLVLHGSEAYAATVELRREVLRLPLGLAFSEEELEAESKDHHLALYEEDRLAACLVLTPVDGSLKMRQVVVRSDLQGQGIGARLVDASEGFARALGSPQIVLNARATVVPFYEKLGYETFGEPFEEVSIPHRSMRKALPTGPAEYARMFPEELAGFLAARPLAILPWGALEWHGPHLPLGLDGLVAEAFCKQLSARAKGVLLPTCWMPMTTLPSPHSLQVGTETLRRILDETVAGLSRAGVRALLIVSGHYAQGHEMELYAAAQRAMALGGPSVLAAAPLEILEQDDLLDHAGRWEAAQLAALLPEVEQRLSRLGPRIESAEVAVLGEDPRLGNAEEAAVHLESALGRWADAADRMLAGEAEFLGDLYRRREQAYEPYRRQYYRDSWEQAISDWWRQKTRGTNPAG